MSVGGIPDLVGANVVGAERACDPPIRIGWGCILFAEGPQGAVFCEVLCSSGGSAWTQPFAGFDDVSNPSSPWYPGFLGQRDFTVDGLGQYLDPQTGYPTGPEYWFAGSLTVEAPGAFTIAVSQSDPP